MTRNCVLYFYLHFLILYAGDFFKIPRPETWENLSTILFGSVPLSRKNKFAILSFIFVAIVLIFLAALVIGFDYASEITAGPTDVRITNLTDSKASISYVTDKSTVSLAIVSEQQWKVMVPYFNRYLGKIYLEDNQFGSPNHHITLKNLQENKRYYYALSTGWHSYSLDTNKNPFPELKTAQTSTDVSPIPNPAYGKVMRKDKTPGAGVIVYLYGKDRVLSAVTDKFGNWILDISQLEIDKTVPIELVDQKSLGKIELSADRLQPALTLIIR